MKNLEHIIDIGAMDELITILKPVPIINDFGEELLTYETIGSDVFCEFKPENHRGEIVLTDQITARYTATATTRWIPGITEKHRVTRRADGTEWNIENVSDTGRQRFIILNLTKIN